MFRAERPKWALLFREDLIMPRMVFSKFWKIQVIRSIKLTALKIMRLLAQADLYEHSRFRMYNGSLYILKSRFFLLIFCYHKVLFLRMAYSLAFQVPTNQT